jgi:hypothetical protein
MVTSTKDFIAQQVAEHSRPAILSSFGKDSMVLLHLVRAMGLTLPVIFHRDPWEPWKNKFADDIISGWKLAVYDWLPAATGIKVRKTFETVGRWQTGPKSFADIPKNIIPPSNRQDFLCGLRDIMDRPKGGCHYHPWDLYLCGHKSSDVDECDGPVPLSVELFHGPPDVAFPLRDWSDEDVWDYIRRERVPIQEERYNRVTGKLREGHEHFSNDYITACVRCLDPRMGSMVSCPKLNGAMIPNVSAKFPRFDRIPSYIKAEEAA